MNFEIDPSSKKLEVDREPGEPFAPDDTRQSSLNSFPLPGENLLDAFDGLSNENKQNILKYQREQQRHADRLRGRKK